MHANLREIFKTHSVTCSLPPIIHAKFHQNPTKNKTNITNELIENITPLDCLAWQKHKRVAATFLGQDVHHYNDSTDND